MNSREAYLSDFSKVLVVFLAMVLFVGVVWTTIQLAKHAIAFWIVVAAIIAGVPDLEVTIS